MHHAAAFLFRIGSSESQLLDHQLLEPRSFLHQLLRVHRGNVASGEAILVRWPGRAPARREPPCNFQCTDDTAPQHCQLIMKNAAKQILTYTNRLRYSRERALRIFEEFI